MQNPQILLIDDDIALLELLTEYLSQEGFDVTSAANGLLALERLQNEAVDAVVLDIMMPEISGLDVLRKIRATSTVPVIMLTGKGDDIDRIVGLELGADDYLGKPCNPRELVARLRAILRRAQPPMQNATTSPDAATSAGTSLSTSTSAGANNSTTTSLATSPIPEKIALQGIVLNSATMSVTANGAPLNVTGAEFKLLHLLMGAAGNMLSKKILTEQVLNRKLTAHDRSIDVHISRLRQKLSAEGLDPQLIKSSRGAGYQMLLETISDE